MDLSGDEECQIETVSPSKTNKSKKARLPFKTLTTDSSKVNKKRKLLTSPDIRTAKQAKVNTKENSYKISKNTETIDIILVEENDDEVEETKINDDIQDKPRDIAANKTSDSKDKKSTPGKGSAKSKKSESKIQVNSLKKFFKKIENKNETKSASISENKSENDSEKEISDKSKDQKNESQEKTKNIDDVKEISKKTDSQNEHQKKEATKIVTDKSKELKTEIKSKSKSKAEESNSSERKNSASSVENDKVQAESPHSKETDNMDVDSDVNSISDYDDDDDSNKSDTDCKKTEHEDTDSKDSKDDAKSTATTSSTPRSKELISLKAKKLTPKQLEKRLENQKKRENREKQRLEREKKLQEERENRKREKEEKRKEREEKEKALKEQKKKEKELKELKKQTELEQKQKEKEAKEEDRRKREEAKEEEKRRKEEERLEAERKKLKAASTFVSFFVAKKPTESKPVEEENKNEGKNFMPFEIKADMRVAPVTRRNLTEDEKSKLDRIINTDLNKSELYINELEEKRFDVRKSGKTWPFEANDDDIVIIDDEEASSKVIQTSNIVVKKHRAKFFLFQENRRPPYYGTWRKKSKSIKPRRPLSLDTNHLYYEVDSDDEWEEEEPGESLRGSDDEKDEENPEDNEYDVDNDFMVPHGYLSEEEIGADEEDEDDDMNPEKQNAKLKILGEQFEAERKTKTTKLKPKVIGCVWLKGNNAYPENTPSKAVQFLTTRHAWIREIPLTLTAPADADNFNENECGTPSSKNSIQRSARKAKALEEAMPDLIRLMHGNTHGRGFLIKEFLEFLSKKKEETTILPKSKLHQKIKEVAAWVSCPEPGPMQDKMCWYVSEEARTKYLGSEKLTLPNTWTYCLTPKKKSVVVETLEKHDEKEKEKEKKTVPLITQFTKTLTAEEMQKQLAEKASSPVSKLSEKPSTNTSTSKPITPSLMRQPKRATLISVPRGEPLPKSPRVSLMDKFVTKDSVNTTNTKTNNKKTENSKKDDVDEDECMIIDDSNDNVDVMSFSPQNNGAKENNPFLDQAKPINGQEVVMEDEENADQLLNQSKSSDVDIEEV